MKHNQPRFLVVLIVLIGAPWQLQVATWFRIVQLHYPHAVENDPLQNPVTVRSTEGNRLVLADGRILQVAPFDESLLESIRKSEFRVDIESDDNCTEAVVYVTRRGWICGNPWLGLINIPLIADDVPINHREPVGIATIVAFRK